MLDKLLALTAVILVPEIEAVDEALKEALVAVGVELVTAGPAVIVTARRPLW